MPSQQESPSRFPLYLLWIFAFLATVIIAVGYTYYEMQKAIFKEDRGDDVTSVADLKANYLETWRKERLNDAAYIFRNAQVASEVQEIITHPRRPAVVPDWMSSMYLNHQYATMHLLSPAGEILCGLPEKDEHTLLSAETMEQVRQGARERRVLLTGLSRHEGQDMRMRLIVPVFFHRHQDSVLVGTVVMGIDPGKFLYPLIQTWPTPSATAEVVLVAVEGDSVVILNHPRHRPEGLPMRIALREDLPEAMAARGSEGVVEGIDSRGIPVLAALRPIHNSEWFLVARMDLEEVYAPLRERGWFVALLAAALILATAVAMVGFWKNQTARLYKRQYETELGRKALAAHYNYLTKYANDIILLMDGKGNILDANERAEDMYGYERDELLNFNLHHLASGDGTSTGNDVVEAGTIYETAHRKKDGSIFPVEVSARAIEVDGTWFHQAILRDITQRKHHEAQIARLNRIYAVLSEINQAIVRIREKDVLLQEVCRITVEFGSFRMAWVGLNEATTGVLRVVAHAGVEEGYLLEAGTHGAAQAAIRSGRPLASNNIASDPLCASWSKAALQRGYGSSAVFPLLRENRIMGALTLFAAEEDFFNAGEMELLDEVATDLAFAMATIEQEHQRSQAESALRESETNYKYLFELSPLPMWVYDTESLAFLAVNDAACRHYGYCRREFLRMTIRDIRPGEYIPALLASVRADVPVERNGTWKHKKMDGTVIDVEITSHAITFEGKEGRLVLANDVTEKLHAERELRASEARFRAMYENAGTGIVLVDAEGHPAESNLAFQSLLGYSNTELRSTTFTGLMHPDDMESQKELQEELASGLRDVAQYENRFIRKDGQVIWGSTTISIVRSSPEREVLFAVGMVRDITERKRMEKALQESEERFAKAFRNSPVAMSLSTLSDGRLLDVNDSFLELFGYVRAEVLGRTSVEMGVWADVSDRSGIVARLATEARLRNQECKFRHSSGRIGTGLYSMEVIELGGEPCALLLINDITERERTERELREREDQLRLFVEHSPAAIAMLDHNMKYILASRRWLEDYQLGDTAIIGRSHYEIFPEIPDRWKQVHQRCLDGAVERCEEDSFVRTDGSTDWLRWEVHPWRESTGEIGGVFIFSELITERKKAEQALREGETRFRELAELLPQAVYETDAEGNLTFANRKAFEFFGYAEEDFRRGLNVMMMLDPAERERAGRNIERIFSGDFSPGGMEYTALRKDGTTFPVSIFATAMLKNGTPAGLRGIIVDITERQKAEEQLRKLQRAVEQSPVSIIVTNVDGSIEYVNPKFEQVSGYTFEEVNGKNPRVLKSGETSREEYGAMWKTLTGGGEWSGEFHNKRKDGSLYWEAASISPIRNGAGKITHYVAIKEDITGRKQVEEGMRQMQKMESIGTLAGGVAHDFNNILGIVLGHCSLLTRVANTPEKMEKSILAIESAVHRGTGLVRQILTFARRTDVTPELVDVNETVAELERLLEETFPKTVLFATHFDYPECIIEADRTQLHQTLLNLSVNARDAMPDGGTITIRTSIAPGSRLRKQFPQAAAEAYASIAVSDSGTGIDAATQQRVFEPFFTTKEKGKGTGLGLAVVYGIMQSHHGFISLDSEVGEGTKFTLYFPLPAREKPTSETEGIIPGEIAGGNETILLVEDEEMLRELARALLEAKGYSVILASDGDEALERFQESHDQIALVVSDIGLPKLSGDMVFHKLKEIDPTVSVILASGYIEPGIRSTLFRAGVQEIVQKPYGPVDLLKKIRETLDRRGEKTAKMQ